MPPYVPTSCKSRSGHKAGSELGLVSVTSKVFPRTAHAAVAGMTQDRKTTHPAGFTDGQLAAFQNDGGYCTACREVIKDKARLAVNKRVASNIFGVFIVCLLQ